ncbi:MAG: nucleotide exchange factor GrpE [Opitutaceae bacterium]|nr:nucleotide exchange factor GrpE [Opitutaceae bacterium]
MSEKTRNGSGKEQAAGAVNGADNAPPPERDTAAPAGAEGQVAGGQVAGEQAAAVEKELAEAKRLAAENYERFLRAAADLENARKRHAREKEELRQFAAGRVLESLLPVLDSLGFGLAAARAKDADAKAIGEGLEMIAGQLKRTLGEQGLVEINPAAGTAFDPNAHEAVSHLPDAKVPADGIVAVTRVGYSLNGRLLRPASVVVSSGKE